MRTEPLQGPLLLAKYPQQVQAVARYGFSWGIELGADMVDFFCPQHMGFGAGIEWEVSNKQYFLPYVLREPLDAAAYDLAHHTPTWVAKEEMETGLEQLAAVAELVTAAGLAENMTAFTLLLYQVRKHYFAGHHEKIDDPDLVAPMFATAVEVARTTKLTDMQKLDFMHHDGAVADLEKMLDDGVQYSLAVELFPEKPLLYF